MTDTAGLIKPLEWTFIEGNPGHFSAITECGDHYAALKHKAWRNGGTLTSDSPSGYDEAKAVCEAAYRDSILPQLNLDAYRAQIRAETLEDPSARRFVKAPEPVANPDADWCRRYAEWHQDRYGAMKEPTP